VKDRFSFPLLSRCNSHWVGICHYVLFEGLRLCFGAGLLLDFAFFDSTIIRQQWLILSIFLSFRDDFASSFDKEL